MNPKNSARVSTLAVLLACGAFAQSIPVEIPYQKFVLKNGLTLIVHEDHKAPIVAVNIWYHVGSKNEKPGKTGFAHLFEHLMFNGSEHFNKDYFQALEGAGATELNGTTNNDRTNYFQNVPTSAVDLVLWMESDRMGHLLGVIDQKRLDEQRGVVQNEKRQGENQPYGIVGELIPRATYPAGHPYSWSVIGSMDDLTAASLKDVQDWFKTYYGAANAVIVLAGDIDGKTAKEKVEKYFGHIPAGPPVSKHKAWVAKRTGKQREAVQDRVPQARIYKIWNTTEWGTPDADYLDLTAMVLTSGKNSRLFKRLVYDDQIATDVVAYNEQNEIGGQFSIYATARPGVNLAAVDKAIDEELGKLLRDGPTAAELKRVQTQNLASFLRGFERIGGFGGKSDILATFEIYSGNPEMFKIALKRTQEATPQQVKEAAARWLNDGEYALEVHPFPKYDITSSTVDRTKPPEQGPPPELKLPNLQRTTLSNGLKVILAERHEAPLVNLRLMVDAGYASDQFSIPGTASLALKMLQEGTAKRTSLQISEELDTLGATLRTGSNVDFSTVTLSALKMNLDASLEIFADLSLNPSFPQSDFARLQKQQIAGIQREKVTPTSMALRVFPALLYGKGHAYGNPFTGSGTESSVSKIDRESLVKFYRTWFKPNNAVLIVVGDTTLAEMKPRLEKLFAKWARGEVPKKNLAVVSHQPKSIVYIVDQPGAIQSTILAGHIAPPTANPDEIAIETMNSILGGQFTSRINMNLREDKHWSYGAQSMFFGARGQRPFITFAPVQTDKTKESLAEIDKELRQIARNRPATADELSSAQANQTLSLPGSRETMGSILESIANLERFGLPEDYYQTYSGKVRALTIRDIAAVSEKVLRPDNIVWVVVGDRSKIEAGIRELNFGEVRFIDADGNPTGAPGK